MTDAIHIVERAYDLSVASETEWLKRVAEATTATLSLSNGAVASSYQIGPDGRISVRAACDLGTAPGFAASLLRTPVASHGLRSLFGAAGPFGAVIEPVRRALPPGEFEEYFRRTFAAFGLDDFIVLNASDPSGAGCLIGYPCRGPAALSWKRSRWSRVAAHIAAGLRLQRSLHRQSPPDAVRDAEAVLTPDGRVEHATGVATTRLARERLRAAVLASDRARGPLRNGNPDEALELWRALVAGRWSLVDQFERDGRRFLVALSNSPAAAPDPRALTDRERQVAAYAALGHSNKLIAYELGLSPSTVGVLLARARKKLASGAVSADEPKARK